MLRVGLSGGQDSDVTRCSAEAYEAKFSELYEAPDDKGFRMLLDALYKAIPDGQAKKREAEAALSQTTDDHGVSGKRPSRRQVRKPKRQSSLAIVLSCSHSVF